MSTVLMTTTTYTDSKTEEVVEAQLLKTRLRSGSALRIFTNCPSYLSTPTRRTTREAPSDWRLLLEATSLEDAVRRSIEIRHEGNTKKRSQHIKTFGLPCHAWNLQVFGLFFRDYSFIFYNWTLHSATAIRYSVMVSGDMAAKLIF